MDAWLPRGRGPLAWSSSTPYLLAILAVAFAFRLALIVATGHFQPNNDPADYDRIARSIATGHGYPHTLIAEPRTPSALRPPGYPYLLAAVYAAVGHSLTAARVLSATLGVVVVLLVFALARCLWNPRRGLLAAGLAAIFPPLIALNGSLLSEPLFLVLELLMALAVLAYQRNGRGPIYLLLAGLLCGAAVLTRPLGVLLVAAATVGILAAPNKRRKHRLAALASFVGAVLLVLAPWAIRNQTVFGGRFVPVSTQDGITAAGTYNAVTAAPGPLKAVWRPPYFVPAFAGLFRDSIDEAQLDRTLRDDALDYAAAHPTYVVYTAALNSLRLLDLGPGHTITSKGSYYEMGIPSSVQPWVSISAQVVVVLAAVGAALRLIRRQSNRIRIAPAAFVWLIPLLMYVGSAPISSGLRYRAPIDPFLILLAAYAVEAAFIAIRAAAPDRHRPEQPRVT